MFNKHDYKIDDASKKCYSRPSSDKGILNKGYEVIISVYEVNNEILSRGSNYIVDMVTKLASEFYTSVVKGLN